MTERLARPARRDRLQGRWAEPGICLALLVALTLTWLHAQASIGQSRVAAEATALGAVRMLTLNVSLQWSDITRRIQDMHDLARMVTRSVLSHTAGAEERIVELRRDAALLGPAIVQVAGVDTAGVLAWTTIGPMPQKVALADREHVSAIIAEGRDRFVSKPVLGTVTGRWTIQFSEAIRDADHTLRGVTVVSLDAKIAEQWAREMDPQGRTALTLLRQDGTILARSDGRHIGTVMPVGSPVFGEAQRAGEAAGHVRSPLDGKSRFTAIRRVPGSQLMIGISQEAAFALAGLDAEIAGITQSTQMLSLVMVALAAAALAIVRHQRALAGERRTRERLEQRDALLRQIAGQASDIIALLDPDFRYIFVSESVRPMLGRDPELFIGRKFGISLIADDAAVLEAGIATLRRHGGSWRGSARVRHTDGTQRWVEAELVVMEPLAAGNGGHGNVLAIVRDITGRVEGEIALRAATEQLEAAWHFGPGLLYRMTQDAAGGLVVEYPSEDLARSRGDARAAPRDRISSATAALDPARAATAIAECRRTGHAVAEYGVREADGTQRWVRNEMRLAEAPGGTVIGYLTDITAEHALEQRLHLAERLATLGEVASGIAHEINQPLAAMALAAQNGLRALQRDPANIELACGKFALIDAQALRLGKVVQHIQSVGRGEEMAPTRFAIAELIADTLDLCTGRLGRAGIKVVLDLACDLPQVEAKRVLLEQVMMNLVLNACDAYGERATPGEAAGNPLVIWARVAEAALEIGVADRAGGIAPGVLDRVFDPFFTTKQPGKGVGLGLSISFASVADMGGQLCVDNAEGGAVFTIRLPMQGSLAARVIAEAGP